MKWNYTSEPPRPAHAPPRRPPTHVSPVNSRADGTLRDSATAPAASAEAVAAARSSYSDVRLVRMLVVFTSSRHTARAHARPPLPVEVLASIATSEQDPTDLAPTKSGSGTIGVSGTRIATCDAFACGQHPQSACAQYGFSVPPSAVMLSPGSHVALESSATVRCVLDVHTQLALDERGNSRSASQPKDAPPRPARSVGVSNATRSAPPVEENLADEICGGGGTWKRR